MKRLVLIGILLMVVATLFVFTQSSSTLTSRSTTSNQQQSLITAAQRRFQQRQADGTSMTDGPCLGVIANDWVADVVHNPRQPIDDEAKNQCEAYRSGQARHFVELDPSGNFIRAQ